MVEFANEAGLRIFKASSIGVYHSDCPNCGEGTDRFTIWSESDRYWCRRCKISGDAIQFARDYLNLDFRTAHKRVKGCVPDKSIIYDRPSIETLRSAVEPSQQWKDKALKLVNWSIEKINDLPLVKKDLYTRGFNDKTIQEFKLGFCINKQSHNTNDFFRERAEWGLKSHHEGKKLWIPSGLVIPTFSQEDGILKLKIRRQDWHFKDPLPKYVEISGSKQCPSYYGKGNKDVLFVVESELDAMLIQQEASDICSCLALGGSTKKPDIETHQTLLKAKLILWCLDNDEAGRKSALWWRETYSNLRFWPVPIGKSPGDAMKDHKLNLREWIDEGIHYPKQDIQNTKKE